MKRIMYVAAVCLLLLAASSSFSGVVPANIHPYTGITGTWKKSPEGTWPGMKDGNTYWYKLDKNARLWWSTDGKQWEAMKDGVWMDKDGKWLKIHHKKLVWSADGKTWSEVPEWKWQGSDGKWYKFDHKWMLWVNS